MCDSRPKLSRLVTHCDSDSSVKIKILHFFVAYPRNSVFCSIALRNKPIHVDLPALNKADNNVLCPLARKPSQIHETLNFSADSSESNFGYGLESCDILLLTLTCIVVFFSFVSCDNSFISLYVSLFV